MPHPPAPSPNFTLRVESLAARLLHAVDILRSTCSASDVGQGSGAEPYTQLVLELFEKSVQKLDETVGLAERTWPSDQHGPEQAGSVGDRGAETVASREGRGVELDDEVEIETQTQRGNAEKDRAAEAAEEERNCLPCRERAVPEQQQQKEQAKEEEHLERLSNPSPSAHHRRLPSPQHPRHSSKLRPAPEDLYTPSFSPPPSSSSYPRRRTAPVPSSIFTSSSNINDDDGFSNAAPHPSLSVSSSRRRGRSVVEPSAPLSPPAKSPPPPPPAPSFSAPHRPPSSSSSSTSSRPSTTLASIAPLPRPSSRTALPGGFSTRPCPSSAASASSSTSRHPPPVSSSYGSEDAVNQRLSRRATAGERKEWRYGNNDDDEEEPGSVRGSVREEEEDVEELEETVTTTVDRRASGTYAEARKALEMASAPPPSAASTDEDETSADEAVDELPDERAAKQQRPPPRLLPSLASSAALARLIVRYVASSSISPPSPNPSPNPTPTLLSLSLLSHTYHALTLPPLYTSIVLSSPSQVSLLTRTLSSSPMLGALVRELEIFPLDGAAGGTGPNNPASLLSALRALLRLTPQLRVLKEEFTTQDWDVSSLEEDYFLSLPSSSSAENEGSGLRYLHTLHSLSPKTYFELPALVSLLSSPPSIGAAPVLPALKYLSLAGAAVDRDWAGAGLLQSLRCRRDLARAQENAREQEQEQELGGGGEGKGGRAGLESLELGQVLHRETLEVLLLASLPLPSPVSSSPLDPLATSPSLSPALDSPSTSTSSTLKHLSLSLPSLSLSPSPNSPPGPNEKDDEEDDSLPLSSLLSALRLVSGSLELLSLSAGTAAGGAEGEGESRGLLEVLLSSAGARGGEAAEGERAAEPLLPRLRILELDESLGPLGLDARGLEVLFNQQAQQLTEGMKGSRGLRTLGGRNLLSLSTKQLLSFLSSLPSAIPSSSSALPSSDSSLSLPSSEQSKTDLSLELDLHWAPVEEGRLFKERHRGRIESEGRRAGWCVRVGVEGREE